MDNLPQNKHLFTDICQIIETAKGRVALTANAELTLMYWHIGNRINIDILRNQRAEYGKQIVSTLANQLQERFQTKQFSLRSLRRMMQFAEEFPSLEIVTPLVTQLSWTHFLMVLPLKDRTAREFYLTMAADAHWSKRELEKQIEGMLYERTIIAGKDGEYRRFFNTADEKPEKVTNDVLSVRRSFLFLHCTSQKCNNRKNTK